MYDYPAAPRRSALAAERRTARSILRPPATLLAAVQEFKRLNDLPSTNRAWQELALIALQLGPLARVVVTSESPGAA